MQSTEVRHPIFARFYARLSQAAEASGMGVHRRRLLTGLSGSVVEVGSGNGLNFGYYPADVTSVLAVEPEAYLRELARQNAAKAPVPVSVTAGTAERLPAADQQFDAAVVTLVLCSVKDLSAALTEVHRVLRPGGELRFMEHVAADSGGLRGLQRLADATCWPVCFGGCHASRDPVSAMSEAGFTVTQISRYRLPDSRFPWPMSPHVRGIAIRA